MDEELDDTDDTDKNPCDSCEIQCDSWEARYCCDLCHFLGCEDCENCDPMDI